MTATLKHPVPVIGKELSPMFGEKRRTVYCKEDKQDWIVQFTIVEYVRPNHPCTVSIVEKCKGKDTEPFEVEIENPIYYSSRSEAIEKIEQYNNA